MPYHYITLHFLLSYKIYLAVEDSEILGLILGSQSLSFGRTYFQIEHPCKYRSPKLKCYLQNSFI